MHCVSMRSKKKQPASFGNDVERPCDPAGTPGVPLSGTKKKQQYGDALRVYEVQSGALDHVYLEHWVERLELQRLWRRLKREAETL